MKSNSSSIHLSFDFLWLIKTKELNWNVYWVHLISDTRKTILHMSLAMIKMCIIMKKGLTIAAETFGDILDIYSTLKHKQVWMTKTLAIDSLQFSDL